MTLNREILRAIMKEAQDALNEVGKRHGVAVLVNQSASFTSTNASLKLEIATIGDSGQANTRSADNFAKYARQYGLPEDAVGKEVTISGKWFRITGLNPRRPKNPVEAVEVSTGKQYKLRPSDVAFQLTGRSTVEGLTPEIKREFDRLLGSLSPENLSCDGELSRAQVAQRRAEIMRKWAALEARAGRKVSEDEVYSFHV